VRQVREFANGAREQLRNELGPEFDELRAPLEDLRGFNPRRFTPRSALTRHLFDDLDGDRSNGAVKPNGYTAPPGPSIPLYRPLQPGERAPFDPDAT
jgi:sec-independent protein translocase protein TatB